MGNQASQNSSLALSQLKKYKQVSKVDEGVIYLQKHLDQQTNQESFKYYLLKQHNYHVESAYESAYKKYEEQIAHNESEESQSNTINVKQVVKQQIQHFCSSTYKIYTLYEYPELTLRDEIQVRAKQKKYFQECQLVAILQTCILALQEIRANICFSTKAIFISQDGLIKVIHNDLVDQNYRHLICQNVYYAPEKLTNFMVETSSEIALRKQIIFSMGMTLLETCCLQSAYDIYNYTSQQIDQAGLQNKVYSIGSRYSTDLVELLSNMLEVNANRRISISQVQRALDRYEQVQNENEKQSSEQKAGIEDKCEESFSTGGKGLARIKQTVQSAEQPSVPSLLCNQSSSRVSMNHQQGRNNSDEFYHRMNRGQLAHNSQTANFSVASGANNSQNVFTDPKLLEMIRKDLEEISKSRTSRMIYNDSVNTSWVNQPSADKPTSDFGDYKGSNTQQQGQSQYRMNGEYTNLNNCPQVQSLAVSVAMDSNQKPTYAYEQSQVKTHPQGNLGVSVALSSKNFQSNKKLDFQVKTGTERHPLKELSSNQFSTRSFSQIQEQIKKDMMKKKQANLVYLQQGYQDGVKYQGMSKNGLKQGYGKLIYNDGAYYQGYFHSDKISGKGTLYYKKDYPAYDGQWLDQQFNGYGELYNQQPQELSEEFPYHNFNFLENYWIKYEGEFQQDNKHGQGKIILTSRQYVLGEFRDDMLNGWAKFYRQNGDFIEGRWENNLLVELKDQ